MDQKLKALADAGENAEKDEALLECMKEVWNVMQHRMHSLEEQEGKIQSSLASSMCRLNNDESQIKLCENKQMIPQIVLQDDSKPSDTTPEPTKLKTLAEFVHESVQSGLQMVDQKQICVEVHSEMTNETLKVFEDMNPYLIRDLPPLIGSSEFNTGNFARQQKKSVVSPSEDVIIQLPQPMTSKSIPNSLSNGPPVISTPTVPLPPPPPPQIPVAVNVNSTKVNENISPVPKLPAPTIHEHIVAEETPPAKHGPVIITPTTPSPVPSVKSNGVVKNAETRSQSSADISYETKSDTSTVSALPVQNKGPPNLADIIKNAPIIKREEQSKKQTNSLFDDMEKEEEEEDPLVTSDISSKVVPPLAKTSPIPRENGETANSIVTKPNPKTILPPPRQPQAPPRKTSPLLTERKAPSSVPNVPQPKKHISLFSSSDEEDEVPKTRISKLKESLPASSKESTSSTTVKPVAPKRSQVSNNATPSVNSVTTTTANSTKVVKTEPKVSHGRATRLFDESDDDDEEFFAKPPSKAVVENNTVTKPQQPTRANSSKVVRKSMFSSSESD